MPPRRETLAAFFLKYPYLFRGCTKNVFSCDGAAGCFCGLYKKTPSQVIAAAFFLH